MSKCAASSCDFLDQYQDYINDIDTPASSQFPQPPPLVADPDIAGLGVFTDHLPLPMCIAEPSCQVILAFLISAYTTWIVVAIGYACGYIDESLLGSLDRRLIRVKARQSDRWGPLLVKVVLILR